MLCLPCDVVARTVDCHRRYALAMINRETGGTPRIIDKHGALRRDRGLWLDLGCGKRKRSSEHIGVDLLDAPGVDVVGDVFDVLDQIGDGAVERVYSSHFFEHVEDVRGLLDRLVRVTAPGAELEVVVPHFSNPYFYSDLTHRHAFGLYAFAYFLSSSPFKRQVPTYDHELPFTLTSVHLGFKSAPPFYGRHVIKRLIGIIINASRGMMEFYEENLCYLVPCYEVRYVLARL